MPKIQTMCTCGYVEKAANSTTPHAMSILHPPNEFEFCHGNIAIFVFEFWALFVFFEFNDPSGFVHWWWTSKQFPIHLKKKILFKVTGYRSGTTHKQTYFALQKEHPGKAYYYRNSPRLPRLWCAKRVCSTGQLLPPRIVRQNPIRKLIFLKKCQKLFYPFFN